VVKLNSGKSASDQLYKKIVSDADAAIALRSVKPPDCCFVAGTMVHTKSGLVPIEKICAGDWVLSQPEVEGDLSYKRVADAFSFGEKSIWLVRLYVVDPKMPEGGKIDHVAATGNHPFWVKNVGWTRADELYEGRQIELQDGATSSILGAAPLLRTQFEDVAWAEGLHGVNANDGSGSLVYFEGNSIRVDTESWAPPESAVLEDGTFDESAFFKRQVFNFEVAETHTYYVSELGIWVHNTNCANQQ
jgi:hypothetical protein